MKEKPYSISDDHRRSFGGKLSGFESKDEAMREKKHLKAYLKGKKFYRHGFKTIELKENEMVDAMPNWVMRQPNILPVNEIWTKIY